MGKPRQVGDNIAWETLGGDKYSGQIIEIDSNVLIVKCDDGMQRAVGEAFLDKQKQADSWEKDANSELVGDDSSNLSGLEQEKNKYDMMTHKQRRVADWKSEELFDKTNPERYNELKNGYLKDTDNIGDEYNNLEISSEASISSSGFEAPETQEYHTLQHDENNENPGYDDITLKTAVAWCAATMIKMILPIKSLEELEDELIQWKSQTRKHQRDSDNKSIELFGMNNMDHYNYLKSKILGNDDDKYDPNSTATFSVKAREIEQIKDDILVQDIKDEDQSVVTYSTSLLKLSGIEADDNYSAALKEATMRDIKHKLSNSYSKTYNHLPAQLPYFSFQEVQSRISDMTNLFRYEGLAEGISMYKWVETYSLLCEGIIDSNVEKFIPLWINKVNELCIRLHKETDATKINHIKENLLMYGWNPEVNFTHENRIKATNRCLSMISEAYKNNITDLTKLVANMNESNDAIITESGKEQLYPIFIVLTYTATTMGKMIKRFTDSVYTHAAISLDSSLQMLYSFNGNVNGFSLESIAGYKKVKADGLLQLSCVFVKKTDLDTIKAKLNDLLVNIKSTSYSFLNLLGIAFNRDIEMNYSMVCSQFVDYIFKSINADITNKPSGLVTPKDFQILKNDKVYKLYEGRIDEYNATKVDKTINVLNKKAMYIKENLDILNESQFIDTLYENANDINTLMLLSEKTDVLSNEKKAIYENYVRPYIDITYVTEVKEFPVQFDKDGNLLIKNKKNIDFEIEYSKSHKLLKIYEDSNNIEGMKYELSKLWFLNLLLEEKIYNQKDPKSDEYLKVRARILNDFTKYLKLVNKSDEGFNFTEYYNNTPFSDETVKISSSTLKYSGELLKKLILHLIK